MLFRSQPAEQQEVEIEPTEQKGGRSLRPRTTSAQPLATTKKKRRTPEQIKEDNLKEKQRKEELQAEKIRIAAEAAEQKAKEKKLQKELKQKIEEERKKKLLTFNKLQDSMYDHVARNGGVPRIKSLKASDKQVISNSVDIEEEMEDVPEANSDSDKDIDDSGSNANENSSERDDDDDDDEGDSDNGGDTEMEDETGRDVAPSRSLRRIDAMGSSPTPPPQYNKKASEAKNIHTKQLQKPNFTVTPPSDDLLNAASEYDVDDVDMEDNDVDVDSIIDMDSGRSISPVSAERTTLAAKSTSGSNALTGNQIGRAHV